MNAKTETEKLSHIAKQDYRRYQFGGSFGGPIVQNKAHFFAAVERTQQDTKQAVTTFGLFPSEEGVFPTPEPREPVHGESLGEPDAESIFVGALRAEHELAGLQRAKTAASSQLGRQQQQVQLDQPQSQHGAWRSERLNEFIFQYADFANAILARTGDPQQTFPNGLTVGYNVNTPQQTQQHKFQFRDDFTWHATGMGGLGHDLKAGVNYIHEPHLYVTFSSGSTDYAYTHLTDDINGPISRVTRNKEGSSANLPMDQYSFYMQDDWRLTDRLTVNAGLRYDYSSGFLIDQSKIPNYVALTTAAAAGRFNGVPGFDEFGKKAQEDKNNIQPRLGAVWDIHGDSKDVVRAGWGIYYDYGFTNANILFPGLSAQGGSGVVFDVNNTKGILNPDGSLFRLGSRCRTSPA